MTHPQLILPRIVQSPRVKSIRTSAALTLITLTLLVVARATTATAQTYTDLYDFDGIHGATPLGALTQGRDGNLYGTAQNGGADGYGVVFKITPSGALTVQYSFEGFPLGINPTAALTLGRDGNFYGTTGSGGNNQWGTIYKITKNGNLTTLYNFTGDEDGGNPVAPPIQGSDGNFYGTTLDGTAYRITSAGTFTPLGSLPGSSGGPLLQATDGNFYGTTSRGGSGVYGTVFKLTPEGVVTIVHNFDVTQGDGADPAAAVLQGRDGSFYGTTTGGGSYGGGIVFRLTPQGVLARLHNFPDPNYPNDGIQPEAGLVQATDGNFYGVTTKGGEENVGVIFRVTAAGSYSILYNFDGTHGAFPTSTPVQHTNGKIYEVTPIGGASGDGVAYSLDLGLSPFVSLVSTLDKVGASIKILGQGLTGTTAVSFNGTPATFKVWSETYLSATVPSGATTGPVTVTTPTGTLTSDREFRVHPVILTVTPASGAAGTPVVITGTSFTQTTKVTFGGGVAEATFTVDSDTQVTATVPEGTPTGYIVLTTAGGKSRSPDTFTVTP